MSIFYSVPFQEVKESTNKLTKNFVGQRSQLLRVQRSFSGRRKLPA